MNSFIKANRCPYCLSMRYVVLRTTLMRQVRFATEECQCNKCEQKFDLRYKLASPDPQVTLVA